MLRRLRMFMFMTAAALAALAARAHSDFTHDGLDTDQDQVSSAVDSLDDGKPLHIPVGQFVESTVNSTGNPTKLWVETLGDPTKPPILFMHGFTTSRLTFDKQFTKDEAPGHGRRLSEHYFLIRMDLRGHGNSDKPPALTDYTDTRVWADDVNAVITTFNLKDPLLVGFSFGGFPLNRYLAGYGQNGISGIVLAGVNGGVPNPATPLFLKLLPTIISTDYTTQVNGTFTGQRFSTFFPLPEPEFYKAVGARFACPLQARRGVLAATNPTVNPGIVESVVATWKSITIPVMIIQGVRDAILRSPYVADTLQSYMPHARKLIYENSGHEVMVDQPERFNDDLDQFAAEATGTMR